MRQQIREVMRFAGPRMIFVHPVDALHHLIKKSKRGKRYKATPKKQI